jgi:hypothetical protein
MKRRWLNMILDGLLMFDVGVLITANGTTQDSTNVLDLGGPGLPVLANLQGARDIGIGDDPAMKLLVVVTVAATTGTSMSVLLAGAPDNGSGSPGSFVTWYISPVYTTAQLVVGARLLDMDMPRPPAGVVIPRFLKLTYTTVSTCNPTIESGIVLDRIDQAYSSTKNQTLGGYPAGIVVAN